MATVETRRFSVVMLPWLAHGHISPYLELAQKLTRSNFFIYFCSTPVNMPSIKKQITRFEFPEKVELVELNLPSSAVLPPHLHTTNGLPPHLLRDLKSAVRAARPDFEKILKDLKPDLLIQDMNIQLEFGDVAWPLNIPNVVFWTASVTFASVLLHMIACPDIPYPLPEIYLKDYEFRDVLEDFKTTGKPPARNPDGSLPILLVKSAKDIEAKYMDYTSQLDVMKMISVGPLVRDSSHDHDSSDIIEWLDQKKPHSTVFVSFGSEYFLSKQVITEIVHGLELSEANFIFVLRFPKGEETEEFLPEKLLEKVQEKARFVNGWAPQGKILAHSSVGGFVSHCGWNSVLESIGCGVPIIAVPMQIDQPLNARLVVDIGVGVEIARGINGEIKREEVGKVVNEVVFGEIGEDLRSKTKELMAKIKLNEQKETDEAVQELLNICAKE